MCWTHEAWLPQASVAVHVRLMPTPAQPAAPGASAKVTSTVPPQLSVAVAVPVLAGDVASPHATCASPGHLITGTVVATNVMCWTHEAWLPQASVAVHVRLMPVPAHVVA